MNEVIRLMTKRKSTRVFEPKDIPEEIIEDILECAFAAPTAGNQMMYSIVRVRDRDRKNTLADLCDHQPFIAKAPLVLVFLADCRRWMDAYAMTGFDAPPPEESDLLLACCDALIAAQAAVMAADSHGIGSCYIGDVCENHDEMVALLNLDNYVFPATLVVFGYPTAQQITRPKPARFPRQYIQFDERYHRLTPEEMRAAFAARGDDFETYVPKFGKRKYTSDFAQEMRRSVKEYLGSFRN